MAERRLQRTRKAYKDPDKTPTVSYDKDILDKLSNVQMSKLLTIAEEAGVSIRVEPMRRMPLF